MLHIVIMSKFIYSVSDKIETWDKTGISKTYQSSYSTKFKTECVIRWSAKMWKKKKVCLNTSWKSKPRNHFSDSHDDDQNIESIKILLDARSRKSNTDQSNESWPLEYLRAELARASK